MYKKLVIKRQIISLTILATVIIVGFSNSSAQMNTEKFRGSKTDGFHHTINFAVDLNKGNEDYVEYTGDYRLDLFKQNFISFLVGSLEYKEGNSSILSNSGFAHLRFIFNQDGIVEPEIFTQIDYNDFILLKHRFLSGAGLRLKLIDYSKDSTHGFITELGLGLMYEYEDYYSNAESTKRYFRSTNYINLRYNLLNDLVFSAVAYYQPYINNLKDFRILSENKLSFIITKYFAIFISTKYRYDSLPPKGLKNFDFELNNGLSINF